MDVTCYGFHATAGLESAAAQDLVSLAPYGAVLKDCQVAVEQQEADAPRSPIYAAKVQLTLWDDEPLDESLAYGTTPEEAVRQAFEEAQLLLRRLAPRRVRAAVHRSP